MRGAAYRSIAVISISLPDRHNGLSIRTQATVRQPIINLPALVAKQFARAPFVVFGPSFEFVQERKHGVYPPLVAG